MYTCSGTSLFITWLGAPLQFCASTRRLLVASPFLLALLTTGIRAQTSATFGDVIQLGGTPSDIVLDEGRHRLYRLNAEPLRPLHAWLSRYEQMWNDRFDLMDEVLADLSEEDSDDDD